MEASSAVNDSNTLIDQMTSQEIDAQDKVQLLDKELEKELATQWRVYPNPVSQVLYMEGLDEKISVDIFDITGNKILSNVSNKKIDLSTIADGTYLLRTADGRVKRFVKI